MGGGGGVVRIFYKKKGGFVKRGVIENPLNPLATGLNGEDTSCQQRFLVLVGSKE